MYLDPKINREDVKKRLASVYPTDPVKLSVKCSGRDHWIRFVTCWEIQDEDAKLATEKIVHVLRELDREVNSGGIATKRIEKGYFETLAAIEAQNKKSKL